MIGRTRCSRLGLSGLEAMEVRRVLRGESCVKRMGSLSIRIRKQLTNVQMWTRLSRLDPTDTGKDEP